MASGRGFAASDVVVGFDNCVFEVAFFKLIGFGAVVFGAAVLGFVGLGVVVLRKVRSALRCVEVLGVFLRILFGVFTVAAWDDFADTLPGVVMTAGGKTGERMMRSSESETSSSMARIFARFFEDDIARTRKGGAAMNFSSRWKEV